MPIVAVLGSQWGDEGKGRVVDYLAKRVDIIARFQGGDNAGHTVVVGNQTFKLHLLPSGVVTGKLSVIGNGVVVNPFTLVEEMDALEARGIKPNIVVSDRAHIILPYHRILDGLQERIKGKFAAGTTRKGIGPTYADKMARIGIRIGDLKDLTGLKEKIELIYKYKQPLFEKYNIECPKPEKVLEDLRKVRERLLPLITDTTVLLHEALAEGKWILAEGAQGAHLDIDHGVYPYTTSSNATIGGVCTGLGVPASEIRYVIGVVKAYISRVGAGPVPTELTNEIGDYLRERGREYGTTTGRPRRCGWLDLVLVKHSHRLNGFTHIVLTKIDVLSGLKEIKVAVKYKHSELGEIDYVPASMKDFAGCEPVYETLPGWDDISPEEWANICKQGVDRIPENTMKYIKFIEGYLNVPVMMASFGPEREQGILLQDIELN
ncbi:MAG: adenylosuccinate synthase [Candidatus Odinarchaeota archaeon]|nr:adenylosuccinate synthase [Candidatus Odinarchaeota archaeon]